MKHLVRAGAILLGVVFVAFVLPRILQTPPSLEAYGFYPKSSEQNARTWAGQPLRYADPAECQACHQANYLTWQKSPHSAVLCENCHGPGVAHMESYATLDVNTSPELCLQCHGQAVGRPAGFPQVDRAIHAGQQECVACHNPHSPQFGSTSSQPGSVKTASAPPVPHSLEGRSDCLLCHAAGGLKPYPADHSGRAAASCLSCHKNG